MNLINILQQYYPSYISIKDINDSDTWNHKSIFSSRCSVFPTFFNSYEELVENVDNLSLEQINLYRRHFLSFFTSISLNNQMFMDVNKSNNIIEKSVISLEDVIDLTETNRANLFIPKKEIICIGHDDYGFVLLSSKNNYFLEDIENLLLQNSIFLLR